MTASTRAIRTVFYRNKQVVKMNRAADAARAVLHCIDHMQSNRYEADAAEVFNEDDGTLHAVIRMTMKGIEIVYNRESTSDMISHYLIKKGNK